MRGNSNCQWLGRKIRDHGGVIFIDLRKTLWNSQVVIEPEEEKFLKLPRRLEMSLS